MRYSKYSKPIMRQTAVPSRARNTMAMSRDKTRAVYESKEIIDDPRDRSAEIKETRKQIRQAQKPDTRAARQKRLDAAQKPTTRKHVQKRLDEYQGTLKPVRSGQG